MIGLILFHRLPIGESQPAPLIAMTGIVSQSFLAFSLSHNVRSVACRLLPARIIRTVSRHGDRPERHSLTTNAWRSADVIVMTSRPVAAPTCVGVELIILAAVFIRSEHTRRLMPLLYKSGWIVYQTIWTQTGMIYWRAINTMHSSMPKISNRCILVRCNRSILMFWNYLIKKRKQ